MAPRLSGPLIAAPRWPAPVALLLTFVFLSGAAVADCPFPLSEAVAAGDYISWGGGPDPEYQLIESTIEHGQKSYGVVAQAGGEIHFFYNAEVEYVLPSGDPAETHSIFYKRWDPVDGWDVPIQYAGSQNVSEIMPDGRNVQPTAGVVGDTAWAVWEVSGATRFRANGSYIVMRGVRGRDFTNITELAPLDVDSANKLPAIVSTGSKAYIAFQSSWREPGLEEFHIAGRTFDGATLGPLENISVPGDGSSDQSVALATDGTRFFAAWAARNTTNLSGQGDWVVKAAVRDAAGAWGPEVSLTSPSGVLADFPTVQWFENKLFVTWSTTDPALSHNGTPVIAWSTYDPASGAKTAAARLSPHDFQGPNQVPTSTVYNGRLHIMWSSASAPSSTPSSGSDYDIYYLNYTSASGFSAVRSISDPLDKDYQDTYPGFTVIDGALHAYFLKNACLPGCGHETDWREMTKLIERPARWYDDVTATYRIRSRDSTTVTFEANFSNGTGGAAQSSELWVRTWNGTIIKSTPGQALIVGQVPANDSALFLVQGEFCGKLLPTREEAVAPPRPSPAGDVVLPALACAVLAAAWGRRSLKRR